MPDQTNSSSNPRRRFWQFGLRTLFALTTLAAICVGLFAYRMERAKKQQASVSHIHTLAGGVIGYDLAKPLSRVADGTGPTVYFAKVDHSRSGCFPREWPPEWLERMLGVDFFGNVVEVGSWNFSGHDADMAEFNSFPKLKGIDFVYAPFVTDEGLAHLEGLRHLEHVRLGGSRITPAGIERLKRSLPYCQVIVDPPGLE